MDSDSDVPSLALSQPLLARGSSVDWNEYLSSEKESSSTLDLILAGNRLAGKRISDVRQGK